MGMKSLPIFGRTNLIFVNLKLEGKLSALSSSDRQGWLHQRP